MKRTINQPALFNFGLKKIKPNEQENEVNNTVENTIPTNITNKSYRDK